VVGRVDNHPCPVDFPEGAYCTYHLKQTQLAPLYSYLDALETVEAQLAAITESVLVFVSQCPISFCTVTTSTPASSGDSAIWLMVGG
jgi:hypothetical protein